jgi:hypothetical protein
MTASDMGSVYSRVIAVLLVLLALAACGGGDDEPAAEQPEKTGESGGLATYEVASFGFSIGVPSDWTALSADEALDDEVLDAIRENDPELAPIVDQIGREDSPIKLFALAPEPDDGFTTNLNVVVIEDVPEGTTREDYFETSAPPARRRSGPTCPPARPWSSATSTGWAAQPNRSPPSSTSSWRTGSATR